MPEPDLNLLVALDTLLAEASVTRAARALRLSASAMSRTLARLREATGDPLLVRAGREMVLTPYAAALRERTRDAVDEARALLRARPGMLDIRSLRRTFTIHANDAFVEVFGAALIADITARAPGVRLHFLPHPERKTEHLREGAADLQIGVVDEMGPEVRVRALFRDRYLGVVRAGHPLARQAAVSSADYVAFGHVSTPYGARIAEAIDSALAAQGLERTVIARVPGFPAALAVVRASDLVALLPASFVHACDAACAFEPPVPAEAFTIAQMWHPRLEADPAHRWLRERVLTVCRQRVAP